MRFAWWAAVAWCAVACGQTAGPPDMPTTPASSAPAAINPANIVRVRADLPAGYEVADTSGRDSPVASWGFGPEWVAEPPQCAALASPVEAAGSTRGWSGSGPGGIVYAVVSGSQTPLDFDPALVEGCGHWTLTSGHTAGIVTLVDAPVIQGAPTVGMATTATTVVEGGTETHSQAYTFTAYLGEYLAFVTVVTDPGSPNPPLGQDFAAALLVKTVSAVRG